MKLIPNKKKTVYLLASLFVFLVAVVITGIFGVYNAQNKATNAEISGVPVPIIMYHGLIKDASLQNNFFIHPDTFAKDLDYLKANGYTTIFMDELIAYTKGGTPLPEKPIVLSFDDGYYNNYLYAFPLLKERNMKMTLSILGKYTDEFSKVEENNAAYSHVTWTQIDEMRNSGLVEIQNHTYNLHTYNNGRKGSMQKSGESLDAYRKILKDDVGGLQKRIESMTGYVPTTFTYPFGYIGENSGKVIQELGFSATLSCEEGINYITKDPEDLYRLKRVLRPLNLSSEEFFNQLTTKYLK